MLPNSYRTHFYNIPTSIYGLNAMSNEVKGNDGWEVNSGCTHNISL